MEFTILRDVTKFCRKVFPLLWDPHMIFIISNITVLKQNIAPKTVGWWFKGTL